MEIQRPGPGEELNKGEVTEPRQIVAVQLKTLMADGIATTKLISEKIIAA